ncbi:MAG: aminoglycoside phosphotransferase family protein [Legionella sp.]|nr:aminoglycoside phosphotransferase family protein [Legionella sp.]
MNFKENTLNIFGNKGKQWLEALPDIITDLAVQYGLSQLKPVSNLSFNYVLSGYQGAQPIILKLSLDKKSLLKEGQCLRAFSAHGAPDVLVCQQDLMMMVRAVPGTTLKQYFPNQESEAIRILCRVIKKLHMAEIPKQHDFYCLSDVLKILDNKNLDMPSHILDKACGLRDKLLATADKEVLLHGDLHHENILKNHDADIADDWLVIDPKGFIGDPAFECVSFIFNPIPELLNHKNCKNMIQNRIKQCAELLEISEQRIQDWFYVRLVLGWVWCLDDNLSPAYFKKLIKIVDA